MIEQTKIDAIREYLLREFPGSKVVDTYDSECLSQKFRITDGSTVHMVKFERIFLDDTSNVTQALQNLELGRFIKLQQGEKQVLVTKRGLTIL